MPYRACSLNLNNTHINLSECKSGKYLSYTYLSSTWREFDPDTPYVACLSVSLGFPYMVSISLGFPYMVMLQTFKVNTIVLDATLLWAALDAALSQMPLLWRHSAMAVFVSRNTRWPERDTYQRPGNANSRWSKPSAANRSIICCISMRFVVYFC